MPEEMRPYFESRSDDSRKWWEFEFHAGDIVITARPKSGMTWVQAIIAMIVYQTTLLPSPLSELSPWVDWKGRITDIEPPVKYRRILKTHSPLGFLPHIPEVHYVSVARDPLDSAVSSWYHVQNMQERLPEQNIPLDRWLHDFINDDQSANQFTQPLGVTLKMLDFLFFQKHKKSHTLITYWGLQQDLINQVGLLATDLHVDCSVSMLEAITIAVNRAAMKLHCMDYVPTPGYWVDPAEFFAGHSGEGKEIVSVRDYDIYRSRIKSEMRLNAANSAPGRGIVKILALDIETRPNLAHVWSIWNQNVGLSQLLEPSEIICFSAKWLGDKKIEFHSVHHDGKERMIKRAHNLLCAADVVLHYNGKRFDVPHLNREFLLAGMTPPSPFQQIDLYQVVKKRFAFPSNKLAYVSKALGLEGKVSHEGHELWIKCMAGDKAAWKIMQEYNEQDVKLLEDLYAKLLPWIPGHPSKALTDDGGCPGCGGQDLKPDGFSYTGLSKFRRYRCMSCGMWVKDGKRMDLADFRQVPL